MAVYQLTGKPAISLPQGATNFKDSLIPWLAEFEKIYLWMDNDDAGQNNVDNININSKTIFSYIKNITYYSHKVRDSMQSTQPNSIQ